MPGRPLLDNILLAQEIIHSMRFMKTGFFSVKVYLDKAYDRVSWKFMLETLLQMGLPSHIIYHGHAGLNQWR